MYCKPDIALGVVSGDRKMCKMNIKYINIYFKCQKNGKFKFRQE